MSESSKLSILTAVRDGIHYSVLRQEAHTQTELDRANDKTDRGPAGGLPFQDRERAEKKLQPGLSARAPKSVAEAIPALLVMCLILTRL